LIWQLRTSYLTHNKDGVGERLISLDTTALSNNVNIRAAVQGINLDTQRTYSPPIPVATTVASEYFAGPSRAATQDRKLEDEDEDDQGIVSGRRSADTTVHRSRQNKQRRRREQQEEDDSSDLSDESDDEPESSQRC
jgi:hypothetical protein